MFVKIDKKNHWSNCVITIYQMQYSFLSKDEILVHELAGRHKVGTAIHPLVTSRSKGTLIKQKAPFP